MKSEKKSVDPAREDQRKERERGVVEIDSDSSGTYTLCILRNHKRNVSLPLHRGSFGVSSSRGEVPILRWENRSVENSRSFHLALNRVLP